MTVTKRICDRCGKEIEFLFAAPKKRFKRIFILKMFHDQYGTSSFDDEVDFCPDCTEAFEKFMKENGHA